MPIIYNIIRYIETISTYITYIQATNTGFHPKTSSVVEEYIIIRLALETLYLKWEWREQLLKLFYSNFQLNFRCRKLAVATKKKWRRWGKIVNISHLPWLTRSSLFEALTIPSNRYPRKANNLYLFQFYSFRVSVWVCVFFCAQKSSPFLRHHNGSIPPFTSSWDNFLDALKAAATFDPVSVSILLYFSLYFFGLANVWHAHVNASVIPIKQLKTLFLFNAFPLFRISGTKHLKKRMKFSTTANGERRAWNANDQGGWATRDIPHGQNGVTSNLHDVCPFSNAASRKLDHSVSRTRLATFAVRWGCSWKLDKARPAFKDLSIFAHLSANGSWS